MAPVADRVELRPALRPAVLRVHGRADSRVVHHELHGHERDRHPVAVRRRLRRPRQLLRGVPRRDVPQGGPKHGRVRRVRHAADDRIGAARRPRPQPGGGSVAQRLPARLLPSLRDEHRGDRCRVEADPRDRRRSRQRHPRRLRDRRSGLADGPALRAVVDHPDDDVARPRLSDDHLSRRPAGDPHSVVRGCGDRRRRTVATVPLRDAADAAADSAVLGGDRQHRPPAVLRGAVRDDPGRPARFDAVGLHARLQPVLFGNYAYTAAISYIIFLATALLALFQFRVLRPKV